MRVPLAVDAANSHQVVGGKVQRRQPRELGLTDQFGLGQTAHGLDPAKGLLDALAHLLTGLVTHVPLDAPVHRRVLVLGRNVWRDFELSADLLFDVQAHVPAVQQVVFDGLDQLAFAADGEQNVQQQSLEQYLQRQRG